MKEMAILQISNIKSSGPILYYKFDDSLFWKKMQAKESHLSIYNEWFDSQVSERINWWWFFGFCIVYQELQDIE